MRIVIAATDADFTPRGKRTARCVQVSGRFGKGRQLRWYVGGRLYHRLPVTEANAALTRAWIEAQN